MKKLILLSLVLLGVLVAPFAMAQSRQINYQGNILDQQDKPFQGPVQMTFELYDKEFGGTQLWSEIQNVTLGNGYFNVYLGSVIPFSQDFQFNRELWVQVTVGNGAPFKRTPLTMVPAAFASEYSDVAGFAQDIPDGAVTLIKLADEVKTMGGDLTGTLPNPRLRPGAALANIENGSITQEKLSPNVTTRPSGAAGGDLTGFFPDPLIAEGAVKTNRIADFAVTTEKLALGSVTYDRFQDAQGPIGTILGWDGDEWIETDVPTWELGRVKNVLPGDAAYAEYQADALGFWEITLGVADAGITTVKIANDAVTYNKLQNAVNGNGTILAWNGTDWYETTVPALEADAIIGNEILNATTGRGLVRVGLGTVADPYTLGIANSGVITEMIADNAVTLDKMAHGTRNGQAIWWDSVNNQWALTVGTAMDNYVMRWFDNGITRELRWSSDDATVGNELTDATAGRGLVRAGAGTTASPYTVGIADAGVVTSMIADANVTFKKLANGTTIGNILAWNGTQWVENTVPMWEEGRQKAVTAGDGTYVINTTDANGFISTEVGIDVAGVQDYMIAAGAVEYWHLQDAVGAAGTILTWDGTDWTEGTVPALEADGVIGNEVLDATAGRGLVRAGAGTLASPWTLGINENGVITDMIADDNVTYDKLQNAAGVDGTILGWVGGSWVETNVPMWEAGRQMAVTAGDGTYIVNTTDADGFISTEVGIDVAGVENYMIAAGNVEYWHLQNAVGAAGTIIGWDGTTWTETTVPALEADGVIGNEVLNATTGRGLVRAGAGTTANPWTLGINENGVITDMIADDNVTYNKLQNAAGAAGTILGWVGGSWVETNVPAWEAGRQMAVTAGDGTYIINTTDANGFISTEVGIDVAGVENYMIAAGNVEYWHLQNAVGAAGTILSWDGTTWTETTVPALEADGVIGNEVLNATTGRGLVRAGAGTTANPWTLGINLNGVITDMIADDNVTYNKLQNAAGAAGTILGWVGGSWVETNVPAWEEGRQKSVTAGDGTYIINTTDANGFISTEVGIDAAGVVTAMLADANVTYAKLQDAAGAAGTIIGWDGTTWTETNIPAWEMGRQSAVTAGDGTYIVNTTDADGFISTEVGIDVDGVVTNMIADEAVTLAKLADGTEMGQVMYFDNLSNTWQLSSGLAPVEDQVIKWVDNGLGQLQPQWANDDLTLPAFKIENEAVSLLTIINNGNAPAMQLEGRTTISDGLLNNSAFEVLNDAGGRGATIIGGTANDQNMGAPYETNDAIADDDAALIVANFEHLNGAVYPAYTTALRAYGDIWTNARVGAEEGIFNLLNVNTLNVVDLFAVNAEIDNLTVNNPAAFLSDVNINGNLDVAQDVFLNTDGGLFTTYVNYLDVTNDAMIGQNLVVGANAIVGNILEVGVLVTTADLEVSNTTTTNDLVVNNNANILNLFATNGDIDNLQVNNNALVLGDVDINGELNVAQDVYLNTGGVFTTYAYRIDITNDALVGNDLGVGSNAFVGNDFEVVNNALVGNDLEVLGLTTTNTLQVDSDANVDGNFDVTGNTTLDGSLFVDDATTLDNNLTVTGASSLQAAAVNGNLNANSRFIMSTASAVNLAALVTAINGGSTVFNYSTNVPAELNLVGALPAGVTGQVIYIINSSPLGPISVGTLLNPVSVNQNQLIALIYNGANWIPMAN